MSCMETRTPAGRFASQLGRGSAGCVAGMMACAPERKADSLAASRLLRLVLLATPPALFMEPALKGARAEPHDDSGTLVVTARTAEDAEVFAAGARAPWIEPAAELQGT